MWRSLRMLLSIYVEILYAEPLIGGISVVLHSV